MEASEFNLELAEMPEVKTPGALKKYWEEITNFAGKQPRLLALFIAWIVLLTTGDLLEIMPFAKTWMHTSWFEYFHYSHDVFALGSALIIAYRWSPAIGQLLIIIFFSAHVPYFYKTFGYENAEHLAITLETVMGFGGTVLIGRLYEALRKAKKSAQLSEYLAGHDTLTNLPNRTLFNEITRQALGTARRKQQNLAILYIDLDHFKDINDSLGHTTGDHALRVVAQRIKETIRDSDSLARISGDEFAVIATELDAEENAAYLANRIIKDISEPFMIGGHELFLSPSIGIASFSSSFKSEGDTLSDALHLLRCSEIAMYRAKSNGRNTFAFYDENMSVQISNKIEVLNDLRHAIERKQLILHYQPQIDLTTGQIVGMEALIRWNHHQKGMIPPLDFIPAAETSGQIVKVGEWVLRTACQQNRAWQDAGLPALRVGVNVSAVQLKPQLVETVQNVLRETGLDPQYLDLELTESALMEDTKTSLRILQELKKLGVSLSIDDFGTGYSSLSRLTEFQLDTLKIDRVFVSGIAASASSAIAEAVIKLGHSLKIKVLAEGIETESELKYLRRLGCDLAQGYYYSKPLPVRDFEVQLKKEVLSPSQSIRKPIDFY